MWLVGYLPSPAQQVSNPVAGIRPNTAAQPRVNPLNVAWQALGPLQVVSQNYGNVTGRVTSLAIDPTDATGNTVYVGTTGGGVWKSTNAAGATASVVFTPLTDTLPIFSANAGTPIIPSLSIGALSVANGVILAGTGDPNNASDSYYGEGILRSVDGGVTWTLIQQAHDGAAGNHAFVGLSVSGFAWSSTTPGLVVAAVSQSAEGVLVNAPDTTYSVMGLFYSTDAGITWQMGKIQDGSQIVQRPQSGGYPGNAATAVIWNPVRKMFYAAVRFHGYYESLDGVLWTRVNNQPGTGLTITACPTNPGSVGSPSCPIYRGALTVQATTGDTFALTVDSNNLDQGLWQDVCGISGTNCATIPIAFGKGLTSTPLEIGSGSTAIAQGAYSLSLAAVAIGSGGTADTLLYVGTQDLYRCSLNSGCALRNTTNAANGCATPAKVSPGQHAVATLANAGTGGTLPLIYVGTDGGLWRSVDGINQQQPPCSIDDANHFQNLNSGLGSIADVVSFAEHPTDPTTLLVSLGANGTAATNSASTAAAWPQIMASQGGTVAIDPASAQNWYIATQLGVGVRYCGNGSACSASNFSGSPTIGYAQVNNDASLVNAPFLLDPALTTDVIIGTCRVWRGLAQSGSGWSGSNVISTMFGGSQNAACNATTNPNIRSLAAGGPASGLVAAQNAGSTVLYAGLAGKLDGGGNLGGHLFANYTAGTASGSSVWTDIAKSTVTNDAASAGVFNLGGFDLSSVVADSHDATGKTVYATVMGFAGNGVNAPHIYRSVDGGAHWTNISSNLPNAPANSLIVDPNDANTLYVAMDTGVYTTTAVATCTSSNCWSAYGVSLPNAPVVALAASASIPTGDGRNGELRAATYGRGIWQIPLLTAATSAMPSITLSPNGLNFATQAIATASAAQNITVTNTGNAPLTITQVAMSGDFNETDTCIGSAIAVGATCKVQVTFLPTATGTRTGVATIYGNVAGGQATATLSGIGAPAAAIILNPIALTFSATNVGATSAAQNITISNTGGVTATLGTPIVTGDFLLSANTCGATLASGVGCTVSIEFRPTSSGSQVGSFSITSSTGTQTASLTGLGQLAATDTLSPLSLTFAAQALNTTSATQQITLTNSGDAALTLISAAITSGNFTVVNSCGNSLSGHSSCSMQVAFVPKSLGVGTGVLTISDTTRSQTIALSGTGVAPAGVSLSPVSPVTFATTGVGLTTAAQTVTLTNNGGLPLAIQSVTVTGDFAIVASSNTCGTSLAVGAQCTAQIIFTPTAAAVRNGTFIVVDSAATSPQTLQLTGTGVDFTLTANGNTTATITAGSSGIYPLLLTSATGTPGIVTFTCAPIPSHSTCVVNPSSPALGGTSTITVTVSTSVAGAALHWPDPLAGASQMVLFALTLPIGLLGMSRRYTRRLGALATLFCLVAVAGCSTSRLIPQSSGGSGTTTPTPSGTYNLVVTGTSAGLTRSVNLTLVVQ